MSLSLMDHATAAVGRDEPDLTQHTVPSILSIDFLAFPFM